MPSCIAILLFIACARRHGRAWPRRPQRLTVKPKCSATTLIGADMPNVCMPKHDAGRPGITMPAQLGEPFLDCHARRYRRRQDAVTIRRILLLEQFP